MINTAGEILDNERMDIDDQETGLDPDAEEQHLEAICRFSHKILKKYVVSGKIEL